MSPKLLTLLAIDAAPGERGGSGFIDGDRLFSSTDWLEDMSLKSCVERCCAVFSDASGPGGGLLRMRAEAGGCSFLGVEDEAFRCPRLRCEDCDVCEAVEPCEGRRVSGIRPSLARLHGWK
jgi:hypothetical protein